MERDLERAAGKDVEARNHLTLELDRVPTLGHDQWGQRSRKRIRSVRVGRGLARQPTHRGFTAGECYLRPGTNGLTSGSQNGPADPRVAARAPVVVDVRGTLAPDQGRQNQRDQNEAGSKLHVEGPVGGMGTDLATQVGAEDLLQMVLKVPDVVGHEIP